MSQLDREAVEYIDKIWREKFAHVPSTTLAHVAGAAAARAMAQAKVELANRILDLGQRKSYLYWTAFTPEEIVIS